MTITTKLNSSQINLVVYDAATELMTITFHSGKSYNYHNVPEEVYLGLTNAPSPGKFFHANIKGKYKDVKNEETF